MPGRYRALLIGNSTYPADEHNLQPLKGPVKDIAALNRALVDPSTGMFVDDDVAMLAEVGWANATRGISRFFGDAARDDTLLFYFSGHGRLDANARLHLCMSDTDTTDLLATAVSNTRLKEFIDASRASVIVVVLDCCHAGAFRGADIAGTVAGPGHYVLSSCRGGQLANDATRDNGTSLFTQSLVDGLLGGAADADNDGYVGFGDLYRYIDRALRAAGKQVPHRQTPHQRIEGDGELLLARTPSPARPTPPADPPTDPPTSPTGPPTPSIRPAIQRRPSRRARRDLLLSSIATAAVLTGGGLVLSSLPTSGGGAVVERSESPTAPSTSTTPPQTKKPPQTARPPTRTTGPPSSPPSSRSSSVRVSVPTKPAGTADRVKP